MRWGRVSGGARFQRALRMGVAGLVLGGLVHPVPSSWAWGPEGHIIAGWIADRHLLPRVQRKIRENFNIKSLADVAIWADEIRQERDQGPWHYANIKKYEWTYHRNRDCPRGNCVVEKIREFAARLEDPKRSRAAKKEAVKYLTHLVADVHQPLHLGNREDRGGNTILLFFQGKETNLHALWDGDLLRFRGQSLLQYAENLNRRVTSEEVTRWTQSTVVDWANESRKLALTFAYVVDRNAVGRVWLSKGYIQRGREIIHRRLVQAGVRLAGLLNESLIE